MPTEQRAYRNYYNRFMRSPGSPAMKFHQARHTFSTSVTLSQGVPLETVSKMSGHKHISTIQVYAKITNGKIGKDMDALSEKIAEKFEMAR